MPQLDIATYPSQLIWLGLTFVALYVLMARFALPKIAEILEIRQKHVDNDLERAAQLNAEAEEALARFERRMAKAREEAREIVAKAAVKMQKEADAQHRTLSEELDREGRAAEARIGEAQKAALAEIETIAAGVAAAATERLTGTLPDDGSARAAVDASLKESR